MCRLSFITKNFKNEKFIKELFVDLNKSAGGDGIGLGWFENGIPNILKGVKLTSEEAAQKVCRINSDIGILFHCRRASVGPITDPNCHPYIYGESITAHNGHIDGAGVLKLMLLENIDKYISDGWTLDKLLSATDSDIMAYFIWKRGFKIVSLLSCGTVITEYPTHVILHAGNDLEAIEVDGGWIFASEFSDQMGMSANQWMLFTKDTEIIVKNTGECIITNGMYIDGKEVCIARQKAKKKNKGKYKTLEVS